MRDGLPTVGGFLLVLACCLGVPLLVLGGGLGVLGGIAWGKVAVVLAGAVLLVLALRRTAALTRPGSTPAGRRGNKSDGDSGRSGKHVSGER